MAAPVTIRIVTMIRHVTFTVIYEIVLVARLSAALSLHCRHTINVTVLRWRMPHFVTLPSEAQCHSHTLRPSRIEDAHHFWCHRCDMTRGTASNRWPAHPPCARASTAAYHGRRSLAASANN